MPEPPGPLAEQKSAGHTLGEPEQARAGNPLGPSSDRGLAAPDLPPPERTPPPTRTSSTLAATPTSPRRLPPLFWLNVLVKLALAALLALALLRPELPQFAGKGMAARAVSYPVAMLLIPVVWWLRNRGRSPASAFPVLADLLFSLPFLIDTAGNALDLYDTVQWWDDANHFVNWGLLTAAIGQLLRPSPFPRPIIAGLLVGFGATTAILWEFAEYVTFLRHSPEIETAYTDTLGDLVLGLAGSTVAAGLTTLAVSRGRTSSPSPGSPAPGHR